MSTVTLELQDVKTVLGRYDAQGKPWPGLLKILDEVGELRGLNRKVGSVPRLKKLIDQINLEETQQRFNLKKTLPDPISALATQLYNQLYEDIENYEGRIRSEYTQELSDSNTLIDSLKSLGNAQATQLAEYDTVIRDYDAALIRSQQDSHALNKSLDEAQRNQAQLTGLIDAERKTTAATQRMMAMRESEFSSQQHHWRDQRDTHTQMMQQLENSHSKQIEKQQSHIDALNRDIMGRQRYIDTLERDNASGKAALVTATKEVKHLLSEIKQLRNDHHHCEKVNLKQANEILQHPTLIKQKEHEITRLLKSVAGLEKENKRILQDNKRLRAK